jgi:tRNA dimethylallyltransferase
VDSVAAARIRPRDGQRIVRALEVFRSSGRPLRAWRAEAAGEADAADWVWIGLDVPPAQLARRIEARTRWMFANGLVEECAALVREGKGEVLRAMRAIGYQQALAVLEGRLGTEAAAAETALRTRQLAKRQRTWFRHQAPVAWIAVGEGEPQERLARRVSEGLQVAGRQGKCD